MIIITASSRFAESHFAEFKVIFRKCSAYESVGKVSVSGGSAVKIGGLVFFAFFLSF